MHSFYSTLIIWTFFPVSNKSLADGEKEDQFNGSPPRPQPRGPRTPPGPPPPDDDEDEPMPLPGINKFSAN